MSVPFTYTSPTALCRTICVDRDRYLDVVGDPANISYEWVLRDTTGEVLHHSDCGYGGEIVALRDGLIAYCGLPDMETLRELREVMEQDEAEVTEDFSDWTLRDWASRITRSDAGALLAVKDTLEMFAHSGVEEKEAFLYLLLLSSRGYVGAQLGDLYSRASSNSAAAINLVVEEAKVELVRVTACAAHHLYHLEKPLARPAGPATQIQKEIDDDAN